MFEFRSQTPIRTRRSMASLPVRPARLVFVQALALLVASCGDGSVGDPSSDATSAGTPCLVGGSATVSGCPITTQTPTLGIPEGVEGYVVIADGTSAGSGGVWVSSESVTGPTFEVPPDAGLLPNQSYQWTVSSDRAGQDPKFAWQGFTVDFLRSGVEAGDSFGPFSFNLASQTLQHTALTNAVQTASGQFQLAVSHRSAFLGTATGAPYVAQDPAGVLPQGWVLGGLNTNVPWTRIQKVDALASGTEAVLLVAYDGSALEYTNTGDDEAGWAPPLGVGKPPRSYGALARSSDGTTFTWTSGTRVVTFTQSSSEDTVWLASESYSVLPGAGTIAPGFALSWDAEGRPTAISDQYSIDGTGAPQRVARFHYGGDSACGTASGTDLSGNTLRDAPSGRLCAFENFDGTLTQLYYTNVSGVSEPQIGQIEQTPGGTMWTYGWQSASFSSGNLETTVAQLTGVQTPRGHDAVAAGILREPVDASWWVAYDSGPFGSAAPQGLLSPLPGVGAQAQNRIGKYYDLDCSDDVPTACIYLAESPSVSRGAASASQGALLGSVTHDSAWRPLAVTTVTDSSSSLVTTTTWDPELDVPLTQTSTGATQTFAYDFLGRRLAVCGPDSNGNAVASCTTQTTGASVQTRSYGGGILSGWLGTAYENQGLEGQPATAESFDTSAISLSAPPVDASDGWSLLLKSYVEAPADGASLRFKVDGDSNGSATLWVNGSCGGSGDACEPNNTVSAAPSVRQGDAIQLVVQYTASSSSPVSIVVEQSVDGGAFAALDVSRLDPGYGAIASQTTTDTLAIANGTPQNTVRSTTNTFASPIFGTLQSQSTTGFDGALISTPTYETRYAPEQSEWSRIVQQERPGGSTLGMSYWGNTEASSSVPCGNDAALQSGRVKTKLYPDPKTGAATGSGGTPLGLSRSLTYDASGRTVAAEVTKPNGTQVSGCVRYDDRGRKVTAQVSAFSGTVTSGGALQTDWSYTNGSLTTERTYTFSSTPSCNTTRGNTCTASTTVDLLGRIVETVDVWGVKTTFDYPLQPSASGFTSQLVTTSTAGDYTVTETVALTRDGRVATYSRVDSDRVAGSAEAVSDEIEATLTYDSQGRLSTVAAKSGGLDVANVVYTYDPRSRVTQATWTQGSETLLDNSIELGANSNRVLGESLCVGDALGSNQECTGGTSFDYSYAYNDAGWLRSAELESSDATVTPNTAWTYEYDSATLGTNRNAYLDGNLTTLATTRGTDSTTVNLGYDFMSRIEETSTVSSDNVVHDELDNLTTFGETTLVYNQLNQLVGVEDSTTTVSLQRLPNGTLFEKTTDDGSGSSSTIRYASGELILDDDGRPTSQVVALGPGLFATLSIGSTTTTRFTLSTLQAGNSILELALEDRAYKVQGTPTLLSPHGELLNAEAAIDPTQPRYDWQTNSLLERLPGDVVLMGRRAYLVDLARFTSVDPQYASGLNAYNYANGDFVNLADPSGSRANPALVAILVGTGFTVLVVIGGSVVVCLTGSSAPAPPITEYPYDAAAESGNVVSTLRIDAPFFQKTPAYQEAWATAYRARQQNRIPQDVSFDEGFGTAEGVDDPTTFVLGLDKLYGNDIPLAYQQGLTPLDYLNNAADAVEALEETSGVTASFPEEVVIVLDIAEFLAD